MCLFLFGSHVGKFAKCIYRSTVQCEAVDCVVSKQQTQLYRWQTVRRVQRSVKVTKLYPLLLSLPLPSPPPPPPPPGRIHGIAYRAEVRKPNVLSRSRKSFVAFRRVIVHYVRRWSTLYHSTYVTYSFLLVCYSNFVRKTQRFWDYSTSKTPWPWKPG